MANFFDTKRYNCEKCGNSVFELINTVLLNHEADSLKSEPYKKGFRCLNCSHVVLDRDETLLK